MYDINKLIIMYCECRFVLIIWIRMNHKYVLEFGDNFTFNIHQCHKSFYLKKKQYLLKLSLS